MIATWFLIILANFGGVTAVPFVNKDFCEAARIAVERTPHSPVVHEQVAICVSSGAAETMGDQLNQGKN